MNIEFEIRTILRNNLSIDNKVKQIQEFTILKREDIISAIEKFGGRTNEERNKIMEYFLMKVNK